MNTRPDIGSYPARVLIVDDDRHNRQVLEVMLTPEGLLLQTAASGEEALAIVAEEPPDLILLDIMMPGMDGYQVAATLKGDLATTSIPVIMVTALDDRERFLAAGCGPEEEACRREHHFQQLSVVAFIVHNQHACWVGPDVRSGVHARAS